MNKFIKRICLTSAAAILLVGPTVNSVVPAVNVEAKSKTRRHKKKLRIQQATMVLPAGYTREELQHAISATYDPNTKHYVINKPSSAFLQACMKGVQINNFNRSNVVESASDQVKVNPTKLTRDQQAEITSFALRLINQARNCFNLSPWLPSDNTQKLAEDIADEYTQNKKSIFGMQGHYVDGIVRACKKNGLNTVDDNYIEDMTGFEDSKKITITELKKQVYEGIKDMLFGFSGDDYSKKEINDRKSYDEWLHARALLTTVSKDRAREGKSYDNETFYFGLSISRIRDEYSVHFIDVSTYFFTGKYAAITGTTFKP